MFGISCPFCGMTRACALLMHGHYTEASQMNVLIIILPIVALAFILLPVIRFWKKIFLSENNLKKSSVNK
ncbi:MAG: DUF2752 domain-containing protein [Prevotella sp.]|nr:DUF2752 domain-containing protein [Prevotella sp.]